MNPTYYKNCIVPQCTSTTLKTPNKLFIYVPHNKQMRQKWLKLAMRQDFRTLSTDSRMYFCEDHFDLPNDMVNYMEYHIMGTVQQVRTKPGCVPSKFECQEDRLKRTCSTERPYITKKTRKMTVAESLRESKEKCVPSPSVNDATDTSADLRMVEISVSGNLHKQVADKSVHAYAAHKLWSKSVQANVKSIDLPPNR